eukprot:gnl/Trimastix_PCT/1789.p1 GENE.gnl/Trimastix_PCT/1789~~gnl/Trimastix_PCT/1789.p1  ORF type:complete len:212 (+),score=49.49 gnl/Trimastix_PCT/1789:57-692(+)
MSHTVVLLTDQHKQHLSFVASLSLDYLKEFCKISIQFLQQGANDALFSSAAKTLGVEVHQVTSGVEGLSFLFSESSKHLVPEPDFLESLAGIEFPEESRQFLAQVYMEHRHELRRALQELSSQHPQWVDLAWRLQLQSASRLHPLASEPEPTFLLQLRTRNEGTPQDDGPATRTRFLTCDPATLKHVASELEIALAELQSHHTRRVQRYIR